MDVNALAVLARQNLTALGVPLADEDLERARDEGFFATALAFCHLAADTLVPETLPDLLTERLPISRSSVVPPHEFQPPIASDILSLSRALRRREISSRELVQASLDRIAELDGQINAFQLVLPERALADAERADAELRRGIDRGPLQGLPVALKDLIDLAGTPTTGGSTVLAHRNAERDATVVDRLRAAGAIMIGKTRLPEFAYSGASNNPHFGPVRNPRALDRDAGGSSSGSAAAVAAGMVVMAIGSDTGGSIRIPAAYCGLVGLKPTFGRVSLSGVLPLAWSLDHLGPLTRTVTDAAISLAAIAGSDPADPRTRDVPLPDLQAAAAAERLHQRVGIVRSTGDSEPLADPTILRACERALSRLEPAGVQMEWIDLPVLGQLRIVSAAIAQLEAAAVHAPTARERWTHYGHFFRLRLIGCFAYPSWAYLAAQRLAGLARGQFQTAMATRGLELLALPTAPSAAPPLGHWSARASWLTAPFNLLGWPAISVPVGTTENGLPIGLQLVAGPWREDLLIAVASLVERTAAIEKEQRSGPARDDDRRPARSPS
ncbi:MAG: amidase [Thermomicrobium sp.]|nr:amidase [Thermomicrobium sp.]